MYACKPQISIFDRSTCYNLKKDSLLDVYYLVECNLEDLVVPRFRLHYNNN